MTALTTRDALAKALFAELEPIGEGWHDRFDSSKRDAYRTLADRLLASPVVIDAATLADDTRVWERICATLAPIADRNAPGWDAGEMTTAALRALAAALTERSPQ